MKSHFPDTYFISETIIREPSRTKKFMLWPVEGMPYEKGIDEAIEIEIKRIREKYEIEEEHEIRYNPATFEIIQKTNDPKNF